MGDLVVQHLLTTYPEQVKTRLAVGTEPLLVRTFTSPFGVTCPAPSRSWTGSTRSWAGWSRTAATIASFQVGWIQADVDGDGRTELVPASDQAGQMRRSTVTSW